VAGSKRFFVALSPVLLTVPSLLREFGGPVTKARGLADALRSIGYPVTVVGVGSSPNTLGLPQLVRFHGTPVPARLGPLARSIRESKVVHIVGYRDPVGTAAALIAHREHVPYLLEPAGMHRRRIRSLAIKAAFDRFVGARVVRDSALILATSKLEASELEEDGVEAQRIRVRPNGIDTDGWLPLPPRGALRRRLNFPRDAPLVLSLGRITAKKGLFHFAEALATLNGVWGIVAGPDEKDGTLDRLLAARTRLGLAERLAILPEGLWGRDRLQAFADADAFCLPSATENFGNAAIEAAAIGIPVVITNTCGGAEWLDSQSSRIVPYGDVVLLAKAVREVLQESSTRAAAEASAPRLRQALDWDVVVRLQVEIYQEVMAAQLTAS
jgi:glycosyltransferase involved in cell wall biosynthesis